MKTFCSLLLSLLMTAPALAQGKIRLVNDTLHLVYFNPGYPHPVPPELAGHVYRFGDGGVTLAIELWAGTTSTALTLVGSGSFAGQGTPGTWPGMNITLPFGFPAGSLTYLRVEIYDQAAGSFENAEYGWYLFGSSPHLYRVPWKHSLQRYRRPLSLPRPRVNVG